MHEHRSAALHDFARAVLFAGFAFYIVRLVKIDKLQYYIAPKMIPYVKLAAIALYVLAGYLLYSAIKQAFAKSGQAACDCVHEPPKSRFANGLIYGIFALPLLLGFAMPDRMMGSSMAAVKGMNLTAAASAAAAVVPPAKEPQPPSPSPSSGPGVEETDRAVGEDEEAALDRLFPADVYSVDLAKLGKKLYRKEVIQVREEGFLEMLTVLDLYRSHFIGKTVEISGFVYREDDMGEDRFVVARMAMQCCSADAMPYGFLVKWGRGADYADDTWVSLSGVLGSTEYNGNEIIELNARSMTAIDPPADAYVYPYFGDFAKLGEGA